MNALASRRNPSFSTRVMSQMKRQSNILGLLRDSDTDEISDSLMSFDLVPAATQPKMPTPKKMRGRPAANKVTKPAQAPSGRTSKRATAIAETAAREALLEKSTNHIAQRTTRGKSAQGDISVHASVCDTTITENKPMLGRPRGRPPKVKNASTLKMDSSLAKDPLALARGPMAVMDAPLPQLAEIPETQHMATMAVDDVGNKAEEKIESPLMDQSPEQPPLSPARYSLRALSLSPRKQYPSSPSREASSAQLRRCIGDLNNKCDSLETKYRDLRELAVKEAERNFDRLQKQSEERARVASALISSLQADLEIQRGLAREGRIHKTRLDQSEERVVELSASLAEARKEIKNLSAKLSASRAVDASTARVPGGGTKGNHSSAALVVGPDLVQAAQMKDDLYADLTGLIVRNVRREPIEDVFDCLQTGRNGTLHFKLCVQNEVASESYEEAQFTYMPQLDESRDRELIDLLPEFLTDEITFPRPQAAKFYSRVSKSLMEPPE
ncbi:uncharacterized protein VDAG_09035 [Verticillium dahliae VdLs.17]|uniref:Monopolin complex subunit Csm1/Pcs1 C-terminal domain-containing protein n=2 Tax=Verticillium dahliae TaxID=27337 RepID=G2XG56_VERDV|nr:uncharacterized protein VDAG_09035 [Verticillium dahliae VdLs.17]EGY18875.1 hypothetical protein VDAG_09035 [Verticillium dahliae VdLs.17]KAH6663331.1 chromosome segregation protein Csm1/Pcs1-domain-containing protein [Verticillium dahliae]KAH6702579.1 chromosome segregation protein Csm1/Pcs1-domain-containing protein [Verticillium dahliae]